MKANHPVRVELQNNVLCPTLQMPLHYQPNDRTVDRLKYYTAVKVTSIMRTAAAHAVPAMNV